MELQAGLPVSDGTDFPGLWKDGAPVDFFAESFPVPIQEYRTGIRKETKARDVNICFIFSIMYVRIHRQSSP